MNVLTIKLIMVSIVAAGIFYAGWTTKGAFVAERDLAIIEAKAEFIDVYEKQESDKSKILEDKLSALKANERVIEREKIKIIDRPIYSNDCLDEDGLKLIEQARTNKTSAE